MRQKEIVGASECLFLGILINLCCCSSSLNDSPGRVPLCLSAVAWRTRVESPRTRGPCSLLCCSLSLGSQLMAAFVCCKKNGFPLLCPHEIWSLCGCFVCRARGAPPAWASTFSPRCSSALGHGASSSACAGFKTKAGHFLSAIKPRSLMVAFTSWKWSQFPSKQGL